MDLKGEYRIKASRENVWKMINDPAVLKACLPGCESLEGSPADGFIARVTTKIGPIKATFEGAVKLSNIEAPASYTISGEGKGGVAGFAKGGADVNLAEDGNETILTYVANAQVGGKLAQLGARLIDSTAKKLADEFFKSLADRISEPLAPASTAADPAPVPPVAPSVASVTAAPSPSPASAASAAASPAMNPAKLWIIVAAAVVVVVIAAAVLR
jgi:carbon monoxide dehydrogenase subunit G